MDLVTTSSAYGAAAAVAPARQSRRHLRRLAHRGEWLSTALLGAGFVLCSSLLLPATWIAW